MEELPGQPSNQMAPIGCFEASISNYQSTLHNIPKERRPRHRFCRHGDIKGYTWFNLQPKSATEIG